MKLRINTAGLVEGARYVPSPNFDGRPDGSQVELLVIHCISLPPGTFGGPGIIELFTNHLDPAGHPSYAVIADIKVSAHFLIRRNGELLQFVPCAQRAWHAGASSWKGRTRCNDFSIGVELEGTGEAPFTAAQYRRLADLTGTLKRRYPIGDIAGHSDVAPGRKSDPGPHFDWARYRRMLRAEPRGTQRTWRKIKIRKRAARTPRRQKAGHRKSKRG